MASRRRGGGRPVSHLACRAELQVLQKFISIYASMNVYMYMYMCMCVYLWISVCVRLCTSTQVDGCAHPHMLEHTHAYTITYIYIFIRAYMHYYSCMQACVHEHVASCVRACGFPAVFFNAGISLDLLLGPSW